MTEQSRYKYIYGPVFSWRLGRSLGIDPVSTIQKTCTFDCVYCQAGKTEVFPRNREIFVPTQSLIHELRSLPEVEIDYITFAGNGEPTLAKNLGEMIRAVRCVRAEKIAVITNASLIDRKDVQEDLALADLVEAKMDAFSTDSLRSVNQPADAVTWEGIATGLQVFRKVYQGRLVLQIMFVAGNKQYAEDIAKAAFKIGSDEIEINTPLRFSAAKPLTPEEIAEITTIFRNVCGSTAKIRSIYEEKRSKSKPFCREATERRRGKEPD